MSNHNSSQTGLMGTYDTNNVYFNADGKEIFGFGADAYDNDNVSVAQDPSGTGVASRQHKSGGTFTLTINQMSPSIAVLDELADEARDGGFNVDACDGSKQYTAVHCYIAKKADGGAAATAGDRQYTVHAINVTDKSVLGNI